MSGGFKWLEIQGGLYQVVADQNGRIIAYVYTPPKSPSNACIGTKSIGHYISVELARAALEEELSDRHRSALGHAGKVVMPPLPLDERAWLEDLSIPQDGKA